MTFRIIQNKSGRTRFFLLWLVLYIFLIHDINAQELKQLTHDEFDSELRKALIQNNEQQVDKPHQKSQLFVKPFVDGLIAESINLSLHRKTAAIRGDREISRKKRHHV